MSIYRCLSRFSPAELSEIQAVAMDMWKPFIRAMTSLLPDAPERIVFDRFHIVKHMNHAVDLVRRCENRELRVHGDDRLVGSKHLWLYATERVREHRVDEFTALRNTNLKTARTWAIKERLRAPWDMPTLPVAKKTVSSMALLGHALPSGSLEESRRHDSRSSCRCPCVLHSSHHELCPARRSTRPFR